MFAIDFFELLFLAEACIPPKPIARAMFWKDLINKHYKKMSIQERAKMFDFISQNESFKRAMNNEEKEAICFYNRFNPDNQYEIVMNDDLVYEAFKHNDKFYVDDITYAPFEHIKSVNKTNLGKN